MPKTLVKTTTLVHLLTWKQPHYVGLSDSGVDPSIPSLDLSEETWEELGCPSTLTITVEAGDTLNGSAA